MKHFKWDEKYLHWGVTAFCVVACSIVFYWILHRWSGIMHVFGIILKALEPFIYGFLIAYVLDKVLMFFENGVFVPLCRKCWPHSEIKAARSARIFSIILTQLLAFGLVVGVLVMVLPQVYFSIQALVNKSGTYYDAIVNWAGNFLKNNSGLQETAQTWLRSLSTKFMGWIESSVLPQMSSVISNVTGGIITFVKGIISVLVGVVISIYFMYHKETFRAQGKRWLYSVMKPRSANRVLDKIAFINSAFGNFIAGNIIDSLIIGVANYIFMLIMRMPYSALVSILMCITNLIPVFGPFIGAIPSALLIVLESPMQAFEFIIYTIVSQQLDGNVLKPQIHGSRSGISGFWIMFAILFFGALFGVWGMLLGVPLLTVIYSGAERRNAERLRAKGLPYETADYKSIYRINPETDAPVYTDREAARKAAKQDAHRAGETAETGEAGNDTRD